MLPLPVTPEERAQLRESIWKLVGDFGPRESVEPELLDPRIPPDPFLDRVFALGGEFEPGVRVITDSPSPDDGFETQRLKYPGALAEDPVFATLRIPKGRTGPLPAVLCLHGHVRGFFFGKEWMDVTAIELTRRGYVTFAPDALPFGERRWRDYDDMEWAHGQGHAFWAERILTHQLIPCGKTLQGVHVWELQRALDLVAARPEVDADRIGCTGHSGGGINTLWLAAMDERVACAVPSAGVMGYGRLVDEGYVNALWNLIPNFCLHCDGQHLLALTAPRPLLGIEGTHDRDFAGEYNRDHVYAPARGVYRQLGAEDRLEQIIHPGGHDYTSEQREQIYSWLDRWLLPESGEVRPAL